MQSLNDIIIIHYVQGADVEVPPAPAGVPLSLLPTNMLEVSVELGRFTHWDPPLPVPSKHACTSRPEYEEHC